jgi:aspartate aminotransferase/aminotransferase
MSRIEASGIRKAFDLSKSMTDPINLSIGLPDFDVPEPVKRAAFDAIAAGHNAYSLTTGVPELRERIQQRVDAELGHADRRVLITAGTSGGLLLGICATVDPGDEVILFDPYFVMYNNLVAMAGGVPILIDTYPDFRIPLDRVAAAITPRTKCVLVNSPNNPTGRVASEAEMAGLARLCRDRGLLLISDEVYHAFSDQQPVPSPARWNDEVLVVDGFSKTYGMTGWRLGFAHGPAALIQEMAKLQQFSFICAPTPLQHAVIEALDHDTQTQNERYRRTRERLIAGIGDLYELERPTGAFYAFPKVPPRFPDASAFAAEAVRHNLLIIPGSVFSQRDTHFRISYAVDDRTLERGIEVLRRLAV